MNKFFITLFVGIISINLLHGYNIGRKLKELRIPYKKGDEYVIAKMGNADVIIYNEGIRNQENEVNRSILRVFGPFFLTEMEIKNYQNIIKAKQ